MQCPECTSADIRKNGKKRGKQNHICSVKTLFSSAPSQDVVLFKVSENARSLSSIATPLPKILGCSSSSMIHTCIQQRLLG